MHSLQTLQGIEQRQINRNRGALKMTQKFKAFELALKLAMKAPTHGATINAIELADSLAEQLTPEQVQIALEKYELKEL